MSGLPDGWVEINLVSCLEQIIDYRGKTPKKSSSGIKTLSAKSVKMGAIDYAQAYHISKETYDAFMVRGFPKKGDILMTTEAPLGCIAKLDRSDVSVAQRLLTLRGENGVLNNDYLMYFLTSKRGQYELHSRASGSTVQGIKRSEFEHVKIILPPIPEQKSIANILSSFDEKIELLREQNETLKTLAQTIFKEWFVNFNYPDATGEMVDSELGEIPKGWGIKGIEDIFDFLEGPGIRNWQYTETGTRFINIRLIKSGDILVANSNFVSDEEANGKYSHFQLQERDFVLSTSGTLGKGAIVRKEHLPLILNTSVIRFRPKDEKSYSFMYQFLQSRYFLHELQSLASGSVQLNFGPMHLRQIKLILPSRELLDRFSDLNNYIYEKTTFNLSQIQTLTKTRDTLLPKLMSGEVRVS